MSDIHGTKRARSDDEDDEGYEPKLQHGDDNKARAPPRAEPPRFDRGFSKEMVELARNVCTDILKLGDSPARTLPDLSNLSNVIANEFETADLFRTSTLKFLEAMIVEQPHRLFYTSSLLQVCNAKNPKIGVYVVEYFHQSCQSVLDSLKAGLSQEDEKETEDVRFGSSECGPWDRLKLYLRLFASLVPILEEDSVIQLFKQFLSTAISLQEHYGDKRCPLAEMIYFNVLISIPYLTAFQSNDDLKAKCNSLIELAETFKIAEVGPEPALEPFSKFEDLDIPFEPKLTIKLILPALKSIQADNWKVAMFPDLEYLLRQSEGSSTRHAVPQLNIPSLESLLDLASLAKAPGNIDMLWRFPRRVQEYFPSVGFDLVPPAHTYESLLLRDIIQDMIQNLEFNRKTCTFQLRKLLTNLNAESFALPNSAVEKLSLIHELNQGLDIRAKLEEADEQMADADTNELKQLCAAVEDEWKRGFKSTWKIETIMTDALLDLMLQLPTSPNPCIYYQVLLMDYCNNDIYAIKGSSGFNRTTIAKVIGSAIRHLYNNAVTLDFELRMRYIDWLLIQLSNFGYEWQWGEWVEDAIANNDSIFHPQNYVVGNVIAKELRVSTLDTVKRTLPEEMYKFLDLRILTSEQQDEFDSRFFGELRMSETDENGAPVDLLGRFLFNHAEHAHQSLCYSIYENLQGSGSVEDFDALIAQLKEEIANDETVENAERYVITLLGQSVCIIGSRSLTVIDGALDIFAAKLHRALGQTVDSEMDGENETASEPVSEEDQQIRRGWLVESVLRLWNHEPRIAYLILEKMYQHGFLVKNDIVDSLFSNLIIVRQTHAVELMDRLMDEETYKVFTEKLSLKAEAANDKWEKHMLQQLLKCTIRKFPAYQADE
ncbi:unnamed protein product [Kuraishia capsulata CBS 1993]|uniref:MIF4G domain-containing protein n=1 Tax=Kuraishia capsulata CBS 1993 TaxID=1382522 RepID=W6MLD3_9ASCO|nr:uncharacterized protein KUCA_T00001572001 [Kuraishia capsulata CBS 1993]CDK25602.1 unnamed protein product [Kuraishia capsulata CBS 1993]